MVIVITTPAEVVVVNIMQELLHQLVVQAAQAVVVEVVDTVIQEVTVQAALQEEIQHKVAQTEILTV
jgi:hypothetical protein